MKLKYPIYERDRLNPKSEIIFKSLSEKNKEEILKFLTECSIKSKSVNRTSNRKRALIRFFDFLEKDWDKITYEDYVKVASAISESGLGVYARNGERDFIKRFLREHFDDWRKKFKDLNFLSSEIKSEEMKLTSRDLITPSDVEKLLNGTSNMKYKTLISVLEESAGRSEEILKLKWSDIDFDKKIIYLFSIKTKKKRPVPVETSIPHLRRLKKENDAKDDDWIFYSTDKQKKLTNSALNIIIKDLSKKAELKKRIYPLLFRHTRLSKLILILSPKVYEEIAGHSLAMGMKTYAHLSQDKIISEMREKVFNIEELSPEKKTNLEKEIQELKTANEKRKEMDDILNLILTDKDAQKSFLSAVSRKGIGKRLIEVGGKN